MSQADAAGAERQLREHVLAGYAVGRADTELDEDEDLLASGLVDSMGVMEIVSFIEDSFGVIVDDEDIVPENFRSVRAMTALVVAKKATPLSDSLPA
jgi:acyl carrier protein